MEYKMKIEAVADQIREKTSHRPKVGLVLGSGLGTLADELEKAVIIPYNQLDYFPVSTVEGHKGRLVLGYLEGTCVIAMQGRFHYYEGYTMEEVTLPIRVMKALGVETLLVTNAAGGINPSFNPGDLMLITDHLNQQGTNPLIGPNDAALGVRFLDMSQAYDPSLRDLARRVAMEQGISLREGVYVGVTGPSYETPAEIRMFQIMGADAVGMSTVPEVTVARHGEMRVLGISCISNMAAGILPEPLSHEEVVATANRVKEAFSRLVKGIVREI